MTVRDGTAFDVDDVLGKAYLAQAGKPYKRNGTLSLFAALNNNTGEVLGKTAV